MMNLRQRKRIIGLAAALLGLGAVAVLAVGLILPVQIAATPAAARAEVARVVPPPAGPPAKSAADAAQALAADLQRLSGRDLRRPLFDSPAEARGTPGSPVRPPLTMQLIGTLNEPGHSMAMLQKADGSVVLCAQGQSVDDAGGKVTVTRIEKQKISVLYADEPQDLVVVPVPLKGGKK
jgi:hypothetical protein